MYYLRTVVNSNFLPIALPPMVNPETSAEITRDITIESKSKEVQSFHYNHRRGGTADNTGNIAHHIVTHTADFFGVAD